MEQRSRLIFIVAGIILVVFGVLFFILRQKSFISPIPEKPTVRVVFTSPPPTPTEILKPSDSPSTTIQVLPTKVIATSTPTKKPTPTLKKEATPTAVPTISITPEVTTTVTPIP